MENQEIYGQEDQSININPKHNGVSILVFVVSILLAILITFEVTFLILSGISNRKMDELAKEYNEILEDKYGDMGVFKSIIELYNSLPEDNRSAELYYKLAMIDYYYRNAYANKIDEDQLLYYVMNGYVVGAGDKYGEYYTAAPGEIIEITTGNSITLEPGVFHRFFAKTGCGDLLIGEVSKINDDNTDNVFAVTRERFCGIDEDEPPYRLLVNEY